MLSEDRHEVVSLSREWRVEKVEVSCKNAEVIKKLKKIAAKMTWANRTPGDQPRGGIWGVLLDQYKRLL